MFTQKLVSGLPKVSFTNVMCVGYTLGKQHKVPFPKGKYLRETMPLELVHSGLMTLSTPFGGAKYVLAFIDNFREHS